MTAPVTSETTTPFDLDRGWMLNPSVALRPEPFGALLYHFGTRKLSFLKNRTIVAIVQALPEHPDARSAIRSAGIADEVAPKYAHALSVLVDSTMLVPRVSTPSETASADSKDAA